MIYSINEGLFDRFKNKKKEEDKSVRINHYIVGTDFDSAKKYLSYSTIIESLSMFLYIRNINYKNNTVYIADNNKSALNIKFVIYKVPFNKCINKSKGLFYYGGSKEDATEVFNSTLDEYIKEKNIKIKYFTPIFKDINACKSMIKKIQNMIKSELKDTKGISFVNFNDSYYEADLDEFYSYTSSYTNIVFMDERDTDYSIETSDYYDIIDNAVKAVNEKIKSDGLYLDHDWCKYEGMISLNYTKSIFEHVKFIN